MQEIEAGKPEYRIKYLDCEESSHEGERLNMVCLETLCRDSSLICSLCREGKHAAHATRPLKFYLEELHQKYTSNATNYEADLEDLERTRSLFLIKVLDAVQKIAEQFRQLQKDVLDRFDKIRSQILQNESRKNQFNELYQNLTKHSGEEAQFIMSNYLPRREVSNIANFQCMNKLTMDCCTSAMKARELLLLEDKGVDLDIGKTVVNVNDDLYWKPANITKEGYVFTQTSIMNMQAASLCILSHPVSALLGKIRVRFLMLRKGAKVIIGAIEKNLGKSLAHHWKQQKNDVVWINNEGKQHQNIASSINSFSEGTQLDISFASNTLKIATKKGAANFSIPKNKEFNFFFVLQGKSKLEVVYPAN